MAFDFDHDLSEEIEQIEQEQPTKPAKENSVYNTETSLVNNGIKNQNVITVNNLLGLTQSHIEDDNECREVISNLTEELNNSIHLMSVKEMLEYLKVKIREREFHVRCIFEAYNFVQKSEYAREALAGNNRRERIIEASSSSSMTKLISILNVDGGSK